MEPEKTVVELSPEQRKLADKSAILSRRWQDDTFAVIDMAQESDQSVSGFIFEKIREAGSVQAADIAFVAIEKAWRQAHTTKIIQETGKNAGAEVDFVPPLPSSWKVQKSVTLKLCREAEGIAKVALSAPVMLKARKEMKTSEDELKRMYHLEGDNPLSFTAKEYDGDLATFRKDVKAVQSFNSKFGERAAPAGTRSGNNGESKLPDVLVTAIANLSRKISMALSDGVPQAKLEALILKATTEADRLGTAAAAARNQAALDKQRKDAIGTAKAAAGLPKVEQPNAAQKKSA